jgi:hypothetical protein
LGLFELQGKRDVDFFGASEMALTFNPWGGGLPSIGTQISEWGAAPCLCITKKQIS